MPTREFTVDHSFGIGWAPDLGGRAEFGGQGGSEGYFSGEIPYFAELNNWEWDHAGHLRKLSGATKVNAAALEAGADIRGVFDFWRMGVGGSPAQHRIIHIGAKVKKDDADGSFADIITGLSATAVPSYCQVDDQVVIMSDSNADIDRPRIWDATTVLPLQAALTEEMTTGSGLDDFSVSGSYTGTTDATFEVTIKSAAATPDTYDWTKNGAGGQVDVVMDATVPQELSDGVFITFDTEELHTDTDEWTITTHLAPNFSFGVFHANRFWGAGVDAAPDTLWYSDAEVPGDFTASTAGTIACNPGDGDRITGLASWRKQVWVHKGPNKGSVHTISGLAPSQFARDIVVSGVGACWHNAISTFANDQAFVNSDGTVRSISAIQEFGDVDAVHLSAGLSLWLRDRINRSRLRHVWLADLPHESCFGLSMAIDSSATNNLFLCMDYKTQRARWTRNDAWACESVARVIDPGNGDIQTLMIGGSDGFLRSTGSSSKSIDSVTAIECDFTTPYFSYTSPMNMKTPSRGSVDIAPKGNYGFEFSWTSDSAATKTVTLVQSAGVVLGAFVLDLDTLGGDVLLNTAHFSMENSGEFRRVRYTLRQRGLNEDMFVEGFAVQMSEGAQSSENF